MRAFFFLSPTAGGEDVEYSEYASESELDLLILAAESQARQTVCVSSLRNSLAGVLVLWPNVT